MRSSEITKSLACIQFDAPDFDGGSPITGFYLEKKSSTRWIRVNKKSTLEMKFEINDLIENEKYEVRAIAENAAGTSKPSDILDFIAKDPYDVPGPPENLKVDDISDSCELTWTEPKNDGGAKIEYYTVEKRIQGDVTWKSVEKRVKEKSVNVELEECKEYEFRVSATNKAGSGGFSKILDNIKYGI